MNPLELCISARRSLVRPWGNNTCDLSNNLNQRALREVDLQRSGTLRSSKIFENKLDGLRVMPSLVIR